MRKLLVVLLTLVLGVAWADNASSQSAPPPVVNGGGATLKSLAGTDALVTVVLKGTGALDQNLKILDVGPNLISVLSPTNERTAYLFSMIKEIRVQNGPVATKKFSIEESRSLRREEQMVVNRALERAKEIFDAANADQQLKIRVAVALGLEGKKDAVEYLHKLATSNDLDTELDGALALYEIGETQFDSKLITQGLASGNRKTKSKAALLAGLFNDASATPALLAMVGDRAADIAAPAAYALGRMKDKDAVPVLIKMLLELNDIKGDAAVFALSRIGGPEVITQVKEKLDIATGIVRYRLVLVLYKLGDSQGKQLMQQEMLPTPGAVAQNSALTLAADGNWKGMEWLRKKLKQRFDETPDKLLLRARAALALIEGGDGAADTYVQDLLRTEKGTLTAAQAITVKRQICVLVGQLGKRRLITIMQPLIENADPGVALAACTSTLAMAKPTFRERLNESRKQQGIE